MARYRHSHSPKPEDVADHYASGYEAVRLYTGEGKLDCERSRELLKRFLPPIPSTILDVGGGPGGHACWLAKQGYEVHLIDITPLHVQNEECRQRLLQIAQMLETEPSLLGVSAHLIAVAEK
ncbi:MAG: class I SAM-dependent methyltransferase [Cyanothece sp. SIO1E1]|nr:class I SAM-dependent methyltransferase [Cyanothece sp. SIO1E1]